MGDLGVSNYLGVKTCCDQVYVLRSELLYEGPRCM